MAVTNQLIARITCAILCIGLFNATYAAVLPEDRADLLFHNYDGDDSTFKGPSLLVRKEFKDTISVWGNYYVDMNSAASIDVVTQGSAYEEEREEMSVGFDVLHNKTVLSGSFTNSSENDYEADSYSLGLSQDFFGDLSTLTMSYANGKDDIYQNLRENRDQGSDEITGRTFEGNAEHQRFAIGWSQILTRNWIVALNAEASVDEGFLRNPYRSVRYYINGPDDPANTTREPENYPTTRSSEAYALKSMYYLPWKGALKLEYRTFQDSWDIEASNYEIRYTHPVGEQWIVDLRYRAYEQTQASFYSEIYNRPEQFVFRASDKELSTFENSTVGFAVSYELKKEWIGWFDRGSVNLAIDFVNYEYENFLDKRESKPDENGERTALPGLESAFTFDAQITRFFISVWY